MEKKEIPISFIRIKGDYECPLGKFSLNKDGWRLCHIKPVGLKKRLTIDQMKMMEIDKLKTNFQDLMKPSNFFLVPNKEWGGLGELREFIDEMK